MVMSVAAQHAKGKFAQDKIFGANAAAVAAAAKYGKENVTNATIGAILDEDEQLVCLPTVEKVYRSLATNELIAYAPISGLPEYLEGVVTAAFEEIIVPPPEENEPEQPNEENPTDKGCGSSISVAGLSLFAIVGLAFVTVKREK